VSNSETGDVQQGVQPHVLAACAVINSTKLIIRDVRKAEELAQQ